MNENCETTALNIEKSINSSWPPPEAVTVSMLTSAALRQAGPTWISSTLYPEKPCSGFSFDQEWGVGAGTKWKVPGCELCTKSPPTARGMCLCVCERERERENM